jgi:single-strand DNA-binding protein
LLAFGRQAEIINQYCTKGKPILVEGRLKYDTWEDKNGGGKRSKLSVVVENFQFSAAGMAPAPAGGGGEDATGDPPIDEPAASAARPGRPAASGPAAAAVQR